MSEQSRCLPYRWILPIAQLLICALVLWPIRSDFVFEIRASIRSYGAARALKQEPHYVLPYSLDQVVIDPQWERSFRNKERRLWTPTLLDIPVRLLALPYAIHNPDKTEWTPNGMDFKTWRAISWPLVGMIFWWIAGRGVEALLAARRNMIEPPLNWAEAAIGIILLVWGLMTLIASMFTIKYESEIPWVLMLVSGALWLALGGSVVAARVAQRRIRIRLKDSDAPEPNPS
jgi:hypothetical protein